MKIDVPYRLRKVNVADNNLATDCYYIASEFVGDAHGFIESIPYDVNVLGRPMFVAEKSGGFVVGFIMGRVQNATDAEITSLYVTARAHRTGIASRLLGEMEQYFGARGIRQINVISRPKAIPFYQACNYARVRPESHFLQKTL